MYKLERYRSEDNYYLYKLENEENIYYLADKENYKKNIQDLIDNIDGLLFDSIVFIFGIDSGEYIYELEKNICSYNKVIIIEPNYEIYKIHEKNQLNGNIKLILYDEEVIENLLKELINYKNFNRLFVHCFGNYEMVYKEEYDKFIEILDDRYFVAMSTLGLDNNFRKLFFENMISNLAELNKSSPLNSYIDSNKNIPAIIVSAGPSLDKNIQTMIKYKNNLDKFFIIAGNRTMGTLMENNITPNLVISVDPAQINYDMMKSYLDSEVPFAFYEYSNKDLVKEYKGDKIYISQLFSQIIKDLKDLTGTYTGGSVAHSCIDTARLMGCNPIILVGQDCALTYDKYHSDNATFNVDKDPGKLEMMTVKDVYGNNIKTTLSLNFFKKKIEEYIKLINQYKDVEFINASYGAEIIGAPHKELEEIITSNKFSNTSNKLLPNKCINIDSDEIVSSILQHINTFIDKSDECIKLCNKFLKSEAKESLMEMKEDDKNLQQFLYIMKIVDEFEYSPTSHYLGSYLTKFLFDIRQKCFEMPAKDYDKLTSNFKYQCNTFLHYFENLKTMLIEIRKLFF